MNCTVLFSYQLCSSWHTCKYPLCGVCYGTRQLSLSLTRTHTCAVSVPSTFQLVMWADTFTHTRTHNLTLRHTHTHMYRSNAKTSPLAYLQFVGLRRAFDSSAFVAYFAAPHWLRISTLTCSVVAGAVEEPPRMGKGNVLFQLRFAEMQLKTCNLFDVSVFLYEFIMLGTSTPACLPATPSSPPPSPFAIFAIVCSSLLSLFPCVFLPWLLIYNAKGSPKLMQRNAIRSKLSYLPCGLLIFEARHTHTRTHAQPLAVSSSSHAYFCFAAAVTQKGSNF